MQPANPKKFHQTTGKTFSFLFIPILIQHSVHRAANPALDLSVAKSDFKPSNLILSVVYMVLQSNFPETCTRCLAWLAAERALLCTAKKFVKSISQTIKCKIFRVLPIAFPLLMWHFLLTCHSMSYIPPWETGKSQEAGAAFNMLGILHWSYSARKCFCRNILPRKFGARCFNKIYHPGAHFQLSLQHGNLKWLKMCRLARK